MKQIALTILVWTACAALWVSPAAGADLFPKSEENVLALNKYHFYLGAGVDVPAFELANYADYGFHIVPAFGIAPFPASREVEFQFQGFIYSFPAQSKFVNTHLLVGGGLNIRLSLSQLTPPFPYLLGGVGLAHVNVSAPEAGPRSDDPEFSENHPYITGGLGLDWPTGKRLTWFVDARGVGVAGGYIRDYVFLTVTVGLRY